MSLGKIVLVLNLKKVYSPFLGLGYVIRVFLYFGHFLASCSYEKVLQKSSKT